MKTSARELAMRLVLAVALACVFASSSSGDGIELRVRQASPLPLPYEPVTLRIEVINRGAQAIRAAYPEGQELITMMRRDREGKWIDVRTAFSPLALSGDVLEHWDVGDPLTLRPGEAISLRLAVAGVRRRDRFDPFLEPSKPCFLKLQYWPNGIIARTSLNSEVELRTRMLGIDDREAANRIGHDPALCSALFCPDAPIADEVAPRLMQFVSDFAKSEYLPYARFALARWHGRPRYVPDEHADVPTDLNAAIEQMAQIQPAKFGFGARFLYFDYSLGRYPLDRRDAKNKAAEKLDSLFPDSFERLANLASRVRTLEEWKKLKPRKPYRFVEKAAGSI